MFLPVEVFRGTPTLFVGSTQLSSLHCVDRSMLSSWVSETDGAAAAGAAVVVAMVRTML